MMYTFLWLAELERVSSGPVLFICTDFCWLLLVVGSDFEL